MKFSEIVNIPLDKLKLYEDNCNIMDDETLNSLVEEISEEGFDEPLQVVDDGDGTYTVIGGNHRLRACRILDYTELPCVIKDWDEVTRKTKLVKRNTLRGDIDKAAFNKMIRDIEEASDFSLTEIADEMALSETEFLKHYKADSEKKDKVEKDHIEEAEEAMDDGIKVVEKDVSFIVQNIFSEYGDTIPLGFMFFMHGGKMHLLTRMDEELSDLVKDACKSLKDDEVNINEFFKDSIKCAKKGKKK